MDIMKIRNISIFALSAAVVLSSCTAMEKSAPLSDSRAVSTVYTYTPEDGYNADNDIRVRIVPNSQVEEIYYMALPADQADEYLQKQGEEAYKNYIKENGTKADLSEGDVDVTITDLYGLYYIAAVSVGKESSSISKAEFFGLSWEDVVTGNYSFGFTKVFGSSPVQTTLQVCTTDETLYRFKDLFGAGKSVKLNLLTDYVAKDEEGEPYTFFRVSPQGTGATYGNHGEVSVRDIGYAFSDVAYITDYGYESGMYEDRYCFLCLCYYVAAGNLAYTGVSVDYDEFVPDDVE